VSAEPAREVAGEARSERCAMLRRQLSSLAVPARTVALLTGRAPGPGLLDAACAGAQVLLGQLVEAIAHGEAEPTGYEEAVAALSGLGPGLTPTGDDLLVAVLVASRHLADLGLLPDQGRHALVRAVAASPSGRTTPVAERFLREACAGKAPAPLAAFVQALGTTQVGEGELAERCARLVDTGAHSGADWLAGVLALSRRCCRPLETPPRPASPADRGRHPHGASRD